MADENWLKEFIQRRARETWESSHKPYYISFVATDVAAQGVDYKVIIAPLRLRQWAATESIPDTKVLIHPVHKAKVGFLPESAEYNFDEEPSPNQPVERREVPHTSISSFRPRRPIISFLHSLGKLSDEELDKIQIPLRTIVRLLNE